MNCASGLGFHALCLFAILSEDDDKFCVFSVFVIVSLQPEVGGAELKLMCHVREVVPYSKFASHEKALMDFSRALMKRKTDEARKNAEAGKYDFND